MAPWCIPTSHYVPAQVLISPGRIWSELEACRALALQGQGRLDPPKRIGVRPAGSLAPWHRSVLCILPLLKCGQAILYPARAHRSISGLNLLNATSRDCIMLRGPTLQIDRCACAGYNLGYSVAAAGDVVCLGFGGNAIVSADGRMGGYFYGHANGIAELVVAPAEKPR